MANQHTVAIQDYTFMQNLTTILSHSWHYWAPKIKIPGKSRSVIMPLSGMVCHPLGYFHPLQRYERQRKM